MPEQEPKVRDLMTSRIMTVRMDDTLETAQTIFNQRTFHHLVVLEHGEPVGVISDRDLLRHLSPFLGTGLSERGQDRATLYKPIHQIMTRQLVSIDPDACATEAARQMISRRVSCLPVIDEEKRLVGIITKRDLLRLVVGKRPRATVPPDQPG